MKGRVGVGVAAMSRFRARDAAAAATAAMTAGASGLWTVTLRQWGSSKELSRVSGIRKNSTRVFRRYQSVS